MRGKVKAYRYKVTGTSHFPVDMLRYDCAWPVEGIMNMSLCRCDTEPGEWLKPRSVKVMSAREPTVARWNSFGWGVSDIEEIR